jgi:hypothetical protein
LRARTSDNEDGLSIQNGTILYQKSNRKLIMNSGEHADGDPKDRRVYDDKCHSIPISHQIQRIYEKQPKALFFSWQPPAWSGFFAYGMILSMRSKLAD